MTCTDELKINAQFAHGKTIFKFSQKYFWSKIFCTMAYFRHHVTWYTCCALHIVFPSKLCRKEKKGIVKAWLPTSKMNDMDITKKLLHYKYNFEICKKTCKADHPASFFRFIYCGIFCHVTHSRNRQTSRHKCS